MRLRPTPSGKLFQYTGLLASRRAAARLADLRYLKCNHARHDDLACGGNATLAAAYPAALNDALVFALTGVPRSAPLPAAGQRQRPCRRPRRRPRRSRRAAATTRATLRRPTLRLLSPNGRAQRAPPLHQRRLHRRRAGAPRPVRQAVEEARARGAGQLRQLAAGLGGRAPPAPFPDLLPQAGRTQSPGPPSQPGAAERLAEFRQHLGGRNVAIEDLWLPEEWERLQRWMRSARADASQPSATFPQSSLVPLARGFVWDCRDRHDCRPMQPSSRDTPFPGARQIDRAAFRRVAAELGSLDADIIGQVGEGGVESRSRCALTTELHAHAPGLREHPEAAAKAIDAELEEQWALGPFYYPPTVPIRTLPRDVIMQERSRVVERPDAEPVVEDYLKPRVTLNPSRGDDSVNAGIDKAEREVRLTTARDLGYSRIPF